MEIIQGIVLKQMNYKESSKIIYVYTPNGKVSVLVHGSNKLKSPYLNLVRVFSHVKLVVSGKDLRTLRDGEVIDYYSELSDDLEKYSFGMHLLEVIYYFSDHEHDHDKLYHFLIKIFDVMRSSHRPSLYVMMAELKLLYLLGVQPLLKHCVHCQNRSGLSFSVDDGGMVCEDHQQHHPKYQPSTIHLLKTLYYYDMDQPQDIISKLEDEIELRQLIDDYYAYHLNYRSRSRKMLKDMIGY